MLRIAHALVVVGLLSVVALGGCNGVLGIDEAQLREEGSASPSLEVPISTCDAPLPAGCDACIEASCGMSRDTCLGNHDCREALNDYRKCLGEKCNNASCLMGLKAGPAAGLAVCFEGECKNTCSPTTPLATMCDLYCGCMEQPLPANLELVSGTTCEIYAGTAVKAWVAGDSAGCRAACLAMNDLVSVNCRWSHCELAQSGEIAQHCGHAVSSANCPLKVEVDATCRDRKIKDWGCKKNEECCSDRCDASTHFCK